MKLGLAATATAAAAVTYYWFKGPTKDSSASQPLLSGDLELPGPVAPVVTNYVSYVSTLPAQRLNVSSVRQVEQPNPGVAVVRVVPDIASAKQFVAIDVTVRGGAPIDLLSPSDNVVEVVPHVTSVEQPPPVVVVNVTAPGVATVKPPPPTDDAVKVIPGIVPVELTDPVGAVVSAILDNESVEPPPPVVVVDVSVPGVAPVELPSSADAVLEVVPDVASVELPHSVVGVDVPVVASVGLPPPIDFGEVPVFFRVELDPLVFIEEATVHRDASEEFGAEMAALAETVYLKMFSSIENIKPSKTYDSGECAVCLESPQINKSCPPCGHVFCHDCLFSWCQSKVFQRIGWRCPQCNQEFEEFQQENGKRTRHPLRKFKPKRPLLYNFVFSFVAASLCAIPLGMNVMLVYIIFDRYIEK